MFSIFVVWQRKKQQKISIKLRIYILDYLPSAVNFIAVVYTTSKAKQAKIDKFAIFFFQKIRLQFHCADWR